MHTLLLRLRCPEIKRRLSFIVPEREKVISPSNSVWRILRVRCAGFHRPDIFDIQIKNLRERTSCDPQNTFPLTYAKLAQVSREDLESCQWRIGYSHFLDLRRLSGDGSVPLKYTCPDGYRMGSWMYTEKAYENGKLKEERKMCLQTAGHDVTNEEI